MGRFAQLVIGPAGSGKVGLPVMNCCRPATRCRVSAWPLLPAVNLL